MSKEIVKDLILPFLLIVLTIPASYYKWSFTGIGIAFLGSCTVPIIYEALDYYNKVLYLLISAAASTGGFIIFCLYSNSIDLIDYFCRWGIFIHCILWSL